jgi:hypothetical protein
MVFNQMYFLCAFLCILRLQTGLANDLDELLSALSYECRLRFDVDEIGADAESGRTGFDEVGGCF